MTVFWEQTKKRHSAIKKLFSKLKKKPLCSRHLGEISKGMSKRNWNTWKGKGYDIQ